MSFPADERNLGWLLVVWLMCGGLIAVARHRDKEKTSGLVLAYVLNLWAIHWIGPALYLNEDYQRFDRETVVAGLAESTLAIIGFAIGCLWLTPRLTSIVRRRQSSGGKPLERTLPTAYVTVGILSFLLLPLIRWIPSATALVGSANLLLIPGLALQIWFAQRESDQFKTWCWLGLTMALPLVTVSTMGYLGYGAAAAATVLIFWARYSQSPTKVLIATIVLGYVGLSVYVTYMRDRSEIRAAVWGGSALGERVDMLAGTIESFEWLDLKDQAHLEALDNRLNQTYLVGRAVEWLGDRGDFAKGSTIADSALALVPRAVWPGKPDRLSAGSGTLVTQLTGITFAANTSVGIGHVMECYGNFGSLGVFGGFILLGAFLTLFDSVSADALASHDFRAFVQWFLPGLSMLQVNGSFVEMTTGIIGALICAFGVNLYLDRAKRAHRKQARFSMVGARPPSKPAGT